MRKFCDESPWDFGHGGLGKCLLRAKDLLFLGLAHFWHFQMLCHLLRLRFLLRLD